MQVYIWGTGKMAEICKQDLLPNINILGFIESIRSKSEFCGIKVISGSELADKEYDYVILANSHEKEIETEFMLDEKKTIYYLLTISQTDSGRILFNRKNQLELISKLFKSQRNLNVTNAARSIMPCISVQVGDIKLLFAKDDNLISNDMIGYNRIYSEDEMLFFHKIAPKKQEGYFLDIGANVGITSIYFRKKLQSNLNYIAFEPLKENVIYLKMNCILNECEDIKIENLGVSNKDMPRKMFLFDGASGSAMVSDDKGAKQECNFTTLDKYVYKNNILPKEISYIWADVQCHELEMVQGAKKTLKESDASLFIEFNVEEYKTQEGKCEHFINLLKEIYKFFICYEQYSEGKIGIRDTKELENLPDEITTPFCNILLMK